VFFFKLLLGKLLVIFEALTAPSFFCENFGDVSRCENQIIGVFFGTHDAHFVCKVEKQVQGMNPKKRSSGYRTVTRST